MTEAEKAYQYFVIAVPESEEQSKAYFWARKALQSTLTQPNEPTYPPAHINRDAWEPCDECKPSCMGCANYNAWDRYGKPQVCETCEEYSNFEPDDNYCANCGRPMTEEAWKLLEKRVRGENNGL